MKKETDSKNFRRIIIPIVFVAIFLFVFIKVFQINSPPITGYWSKVGTVYTCDNCTDCNNSIADASAGDTIELSASITDAVGDCIGFNGKDNLIFDCLGNFINGDNTGSSDKGIEIDGENITIRNCNISDFGYGVYVYEGNTTLVNITSTSNGYAGILFQSANLNTLIDSTLYDNPTDFDIETSSAADCNNVIRNVTGTGDNLIVYYNNTVNLQDWGNNFSALILCNADNSTINNFTISSEVYGLVLYLTDNSNVTNSRFENCYYGVESVRGANNTFANLTFISNSGRGFSTRDDKNITLNAMNFSSIDGTGIYIQGTVNSTFMNLNFTDSGSYSIYLTTGSKMNTLKNITVGACDSGGIFYIGDDKNIFEEITLNLSSRGFRIEGAEQNILRNIRVFNITDSSAYSAITVVSSYNNTFNNITSQNNFYGMYFSDSSNNTITNSSLRNNTAFDFYIETTKGTYCNNRLINVTGTDAKPIIYYNNTVNLQDWNDNVSELILCNATNSIINNFTMNHTEKRVNGILIVRTNNSNFTNIYVENSYHGIRLYNSSGNYLANITSNTNGNMGLYVTKSFNLVVNNMTARNNSPENGYGLYLISSGYSTLGNITVVSSRIGIYTQGNYFYMRNINASLNSLFGIGFNGDNNTLLDIISNSNAQGIEISYGTNSTLINVTANLNSQYGLYFYQGANNTIINSSFRNNSQFDVYVAPTTSDVYCDNTLINVTGTDDKSILYYNRASVNLQDWNNNFSELILCNADYSVINNFTINHTIGFRSSGILLSRTDFSNITEIKAENLYHGIYLYQSHNNSLINITSKFNNGSGIYLRTSSNNTLFNITSANNFYGISLYGSSSSNNLISNSSIKWNTANGVNYTSGSGIYLYISHNNTIKDTQIRHNYKEAIYLSYSYQNNITNNIIENHSNGGIKFEGGSKKNIFYNNFFNNSLNYNDTASADNYFNITRTSATNIVGGRSMGGNYWANINGTGFSEISCVDEDEDNICDASYSLGDGNYDFLPLTLVSFSLPEATTSGSPGGPSPTATASQIVSIGSTSGGDSATVSITNPKLDVTEMVITVRDTISGASMTVSEVSALTDGGFQIGLPSGMIYQAFNVTTLGISDDNISKIIINFKVNKTWLEEQNLTSLDVNLYRKKNNETDFNSLSTTYIGGDENYYYYSALSPGFSTFLIFVSPEECIPAEKRCVGNEVHFCLGDKKWLVSEVCDYQCKDGECIEKGLQVNLNPLVVYPIIGIVVVGVLISFLAQRMPKKKKKKKGQLNSGAINDYFEKMN